MRVSALSLVASATTLVVSAPAFAADYRFDLQATGEQRSQFSNGAEQIDDIGAKTIVRVIEPRDVIDKTGSIVVLVLNAGDGPFNFGPENVSLRFGDGATFAMLNYAELMRRQQNREKRQRFAMALAAAGRSMSAGQAGYTYGTASYSGHTNGTFGSTPYRATTFGTGTYSAYDPAKAQVATAVANEQNRRAIAEMQARQNRERAMIGQIMQTTTVQPSDVFGGIVQFDIPKPAKSGNRPVPVTLEVRIGDQLHSFQGTFTKE